MICRSTPKSSRQRQSPTVSVNSNVSDSDYDNMANDSDDNCVDVIEPQLSASDHEVSDSDDIDQTEIEKGPQDKRWRYEKTFQNKESLDEFLETETWWSYRSENSCTQGIKLLYRCNSVARTSKNQCEAGIYIIKSIEFGDADCDNSTSYLLYRKNALYTHRRSSEYKAKVTNKVKNAIIEQYRNGRKPKSISYFILDDSTIPLKEKPSYKQILKIITNFKNNGSGSQDITMRKLTEFVKQHLKLPAGEDEAFVVRFERSLKEQSRDKFFRFFISTKRLLSNAANSTIVQADSTHKVTTEKYR